MDELTRYIINNYTDLMTLYEKAALKNVVIETKADLATSESFKARLREQLVINEPTVRELLKDGAEAFLESVRNRVLQESPGEVFMYPFTGS